MSVSEEMKDRIYKRKDTEELEPSLTSPSTEYYPEKKVKPLTRSVRTIRPDYIFETAEAPTTTEVRFFLLLSITLRKNSFVVLLSFMKWDQELLDTF